MDMMRLTGRDSKLSLLQLRKVKEKIESVYPGMQVQIIARSSRGDALKDVPLQTVEGSDFFTQDIFDELENGHADIAVHSLKDMSSEHFFGLNVFGVVDRDDTRDVAIFASNITKKIGDGEMIRVGTCSPRREVMATVFLQQALPQLGNQIRIETKIIRGNVDTRLRKLDAGEYDAIILATAGINRLLASEADYTATWELLKDKKLMLLPLIECVPAPCQGAIVAEAHPGNLKAVEVVKAINDPVAYNDCRFEKTIAREYGTGCLQEFGVTSIGYAEGKVLYAAGKKSNGQSFQEWKGLPSVSIKDQQLFSTTDFMGGFFSYRYNNTDISISQAVVYVANYKAAESTNVLQELRGKRVWAAGVKTWMELAKKGIWVEGSADAFGLEFLQSPWQMPLFTIARDEVAVVTNNQSAIEWQHKGWHSYGTYDTVEKKSPVVEQKIKDADAIFWTSYRQYQQYMDVVKRSVQHMCPSGETANQFRAAGIEPIVFPNIKAFQQWRQTLAH